MKTEDTTSYREQLHALRASLQEQLSTQRAAAAGHAQVSSEHFGHPDEAGSQMASERGLESAIDQRETAELALIDAALARIEAGRYGECTDCAADIAPARLHATPEAPRCIHCQEKVEHHRAH
ncbi:MAG: TraR/DksA family transcriptional regulator [Rhodoferax sp.]